MQTFAPRVIDFAYCLAALCGWTAHFLRDRWSRERPAFDWLLCGPMSCSEELAKGVLQQWHDGEYYWMGKTSPWEPAFEMLQRCIKTWRLTFTESPG